MFGGSQTLPLRPVMPRCDRRRQVDANLLPTKLYGDFGGLADGAAEFRSSATGGIRSPVAALDHDLVHEFRTISRIRQGSSRPAARSAAAKAAALTPQRAGRRRESPFV
jgi:hypothetical protein